MKRKKLDKKHIGIQFFTMMMSLIAFLILATFVGEITWIKDFQYFVILLSGIFSIFIGVLALLRYYTDRSRAKFLLLGFGFLGVGLLEVVKLIVDIGAFRNLFVYVPGEIYPFSSILSRSFLALLVFLSWAFIGTTKVKKKIKKKERLIIAIIVAVFTILLGLTSYLVLKQIILDPLWVVFVGIVTLMFYVLALVGYLLKKEWRYENLHFWIIYSISFLILSQIFFLPFLNLEYYNMINLSIWAKFFSYVVLLVGFLNSIYELYQREVEIQKELKKKNRLLEKTKQKVEDAYLVIREEKWELAEKEGKKKKSKKKGSKKKTTKKKSTKKTKTKKKKGKGK